MRTLGPDDIEAAGACLGAAMADDPFYRWLHPHDGRRARWLPGFMARLVRLLAPHGAVWAPGPEAVIGLLPPGAPPHPLGAQTRFAWETLMAPGGPGARRLVAGARALHALEAHRPEPPHWYVVIAGVAPAGQGRGFGRTLLEAACDAADADGVPVYLETTNPANLAFYGRFGLQVEAEVALEGGAPPAWTLRRPVGCRSPFA